MIIRSSGMAYVPCYPGQKVFRSSAKHRMPYELFNLIKKDKPDIVILDISLPKMSGIKIMKILTHEYDNIKVLVLSMHTGEEFVFNAIKAGAKGYLPKNTTKKELLEAISNHKQK